MSKLPPHHRSNLFSTVLYITILVFLVVLMSGIGYYLSVWQYLRNDIGHNNDIKLDQLSAAYEVLLDSTLSAAMIYIESDAKNVLADSKDNEQSRNNRIFRHLDNLSRISNYIDSIYFFEQTPHTLYHSSGISFELSDFYDADWVQTLNTTKDFYVLPARKMPAITAGEKDIVPIIVNYPFSSLSKACSYVINLQADLFFNDLVKNIDDDDPQDFKIIDPSGVVFISRGSKSNFMSIDDFPHLAAYANELLTNPSGRFMGKNGQQSILVSYRVSSQYHWIYISELNYSHVSSQLQKPLNLILQISIILLIASLLLGLLFSHRLFKPVKDLFNLVISFTGRQSGNEYETLKSYLHDSYHANVIMQNQLQSNALALRKLFLNQLLTRNYYSQQEIDEQLPELGLTANGHYIVIVFLFDEYQKYVSTFSKEDRALWEFSFENIALEIASRYGSALFAPLEANRFALLLHTSNSDLASPEKSALKMAIEIKDAIRGFLKFSMSAGIGSQTLSIYSVDKSYVHANTALKLKGECIDEAVCFHDMVADSKPLLYRHEDERQLMEWIVMGDTKQVCEYLDLMYISFKTDNPTHQSGVLFFSFFIISAVMKQANEFGLAEEEILPKMSLPDFLSSIQSVANETQALELLRQALSYISQVIVDKRSQMTNGQVQQIMVYVNQNYNQPISLDTIAEQVNLNSSYVSRLIKQHLKMGIVSSHIPIILISHPI